MANIKIVNLSSNLIPVGSDLFKDSESFMADLIERELDGSSGGLVLPIHSPYCAPIYSPLCKPIKPIYPRPTLPPKS